MSDELANQITRVGVHRQDEPQRAISIIEVQRDGTAAVVDETAILINA